MKAPFLSRTLIMASTVVVIAAVIYLFLPSPRLNGTISRSASSAPPLAAYGIDIQQTSVSGVSSGGAMALQMHVAHSSIMRGVGITAGVAYDCADSDLPSAAQRVLRGDILCLTGSVGADAAFSISRTAVAAAVPGAIDDPALHLPRQKVWLFSGYNDGTVRRAAMDGVAAYYKHYVEPGNVFYKTNNHAPHALVTDGYGGECLGVNDEYINNCRYDAAHRLLEHIYGRLNSSSSSGSSVSILPFDQREFVTGNARSIGLADTGYVYVPTACRTQTCRAHIVFHGCKQYAEKLGDAVYRHSGYNEWADTSKLVVLYPQTVATEPGPLHPDLPLNPKGCWDWWGLSDNDHDFARKTGHQISAIRAMLDRLAAQFTPGTAPSDAFGPPQKFSATDSSSTSIELTWEPNTAAVGYNIYRSPSSTGPYAKINSNTVSGASFADTGLAPNSTYYYEIRAIDRQSGQESAPTSPEAGSTAPVPPACDPYFSDNVTHVSEGRAYTYFGYTFAIGSNDLMGLFAPDDFSHLVKEQAFKYRVDYCP